MAALEKSSPAVEAAALERYWTQKSVCAANGQLLKVAKGIGSTNGHTHAKEDEVFFVLNGQFIVELRGQTVTLDPGDLFVVPMGVEHRPRTVIETTILVIGPSVTSRREGGKPDWSGG